MAKGELLSAARRRWRLVDVGAGYGRDVRIIAREADIEPIAVEVADGFVEALRRSEARGEIPRGSVVKADMRRLDGIESMSVECVRLHATLHHLPVLWPGVGADAAVAEAHRVLVPGGVLCVTVKYGTGFRLVDTSEGLGGRAYQFFSAGMLVDLLDRNGFEVFRLERRMERRDQGTVDWLFALASADRSPEAEAEAEAESGPGLGSGDSVGAA